MTIRTVAAQDREIERSAFNAAFHELGLRWHWDADTYEALAANPCERARVRYYVESAHPHLLRAYDAEFLADAVLKIKARWQRAMAHSSNRALPNFDWADARWGEVGV